MSVTAISKVVTANDLRSGEVLYLQLPAQLDPRIGEGVSDQRQ